MFSFFDDVNMPGVAESSKFEAIPAASEVNVKVCFSSIFRQWFDSIAGG